MTNIAILDDYQKVALDIAPWGTLPAEAKVTVFNDHLADLDALADRLRDFEIVVAMRERTPFSRRTFERLPRLKLLVTTAMANDAIDLAAATDHGVVVCGTGALVPYTGELTWGLILALARQLPREDLAIRQGRWQTTLGVGLHGKVLGVVGLGRTGSQMAGFGKAFGMSVIAWSQNLTAEKAAQFGATLVTKDEIFSRADVLTIHLKLSDRTVGIVGRRELGLMKRTAFLINTSRGPIVQEAALVQALQDRSIAGAGLDVYDVEPLPPDHPFKRLDNTVLSPHIGYVTKEQYLVFYGDSVEDISAFLRGNPVRVINPAVLEKLRKPA